MVILVPVIILISWKGLIEKFGGAFALSNCITVGLTAIGLMGYSNSVARDRDKGVFQRLRVAPVPSWSIMTSRLIVQLALIVIMILAVFFAGYKYDHISLGRSAYIMSILASFIGGAMYLGLGQAIVGMITNPETVSSTSRLVYFFFIMIGLFGAFGALGETLGQIVRWSPYGVVAHILSSSMHPESWDGEATKALALAFAYTALFSTLGIRWFKWNTAK